MENDKFSIGICISGITLVALFIFLHHNAKVKCEKSGGVLVSESMGKTYKLMCVK